MSPPSSRWGILPLIVALLLAAAVFYVAIVIPATKNPRLYDTGLPIAGIVLSALLFLAGHFSYPRVQNLKVYLAGYLCGLTGIVYFLLYRNAPRADVLVTTLLIITFVNFLLVLVLPSFVKYRTTRQTTILIVAVEVLIYTILRFVPEWTGPLSQVTRMGLGQWSTWIASIWLAAVFGLSIWRLRNEFYLGGVLAGVAVVYAIAWLAPRIFNHSDDLELLAFTTVPLILNIGILYHWFSRMEHRVSYDPLLHIYNRNYCSRIISEQSNLKTTPPFGVAMIDIDHFKKVNDSYGHQAGDQVLYAVAQAISREIVPEGVVCRYGGEEMVVFFPKKSTKDVVPIIETVRETIEAMKVPTRRKRLGVTVSCGISHRQDASQSIIDVIHAADKALYRAKKNGRNQVKTGKTSVPGAKKK